MKSILLFVLFAPLLYGSTNVDSIARAISTGNVAVLEQYLDQSVEVSVLNQEGIYDKTGASAVLKNFFGKHSPKAFTQVHQGTSKGNDSVYCIGNLSTNAGVFRVYIFMRMENGKHFIQEFRIDKE
jgi:hypothetical protein